jgi:hypothetical protein
VVIVVLHQSRNWNSPFSTWTLDYVVYSYVAVLLVLAVILVVPALIGGTWWLRRELRS